VGVVVTPRYKQFVSVSLGYSCGQIITVSVLIPSNLLVIKQFCN